VIVRVHVEDHEFLIEALIALIGQRYIVGHRESQRTAHIVLQNSWCELPRQ